MLLIADSGSTKTDWVFCNTENGVIKIVSSVGFNPIVQSENFIREKINETFKIFQKFKLSLIFTSLVLVVLLNLVEMSLKISLKKSS